MTDIAIRVENLSKLYHIGRAQQRHDTLRDAISDFRLRISDPLRSANPAARDASSPQSAIRSPQSEDLWALRDVSFEVQRGEVVGIIGRNGAGKSTLLKILSRITEPTGGRAEIHGRVGSLLEVGTGFHPELTGRENIFLNGAILGMRRHEIQRKFDEIVAFAEIERFLDTPVKRYSSGMYVRLAFAVAAHLEPEILLVDEVLAVGDVQFQRKCLGKIENVAREGRTVLFVSHNMAAIEHICSFCLQVHNGSIVDTGSPSDVIRRYINSTTAKPLTLKNISMGLPLKDVQLWDETGRVTDVFRPGMTLRVILRIEDNEKLLRTPVIGIGFNTLMGERVFTVGTYFSGDEFRPIHGRWSVVCEIPELPLVPGEYSLKVALGNDYNNNLVEIEDITHLHVVPGDFFGTGRLPGPSQGLLLVRSKWNMVFEIPE